MHTHDVRTRLGEALCAPSAWAGTGPEAIALEEHASAGCSICARALVNARELAVDLALAEAPALAQPPSARAVERLLHRTRDVLAARRGRARPDMHSVRQLVPRVLDPSAAVAHEHLTHPSEPDRTREIDALQAVTPRPGEGAPRLLAQLARFLDFPILFVTIVRGEKAIYRAQHGLPSSLASFRELRREMSYCTHTVSGGAPLVIENARVEPFFRGNKAVTRFGIAAYAGVPLRTTTGIVVGTLCALDFEPRAITPETVALLEVFARRAVAELERERTPALLASALEATSTKGDIHSEDIFRALIAAQHARQPSALLAIRASSAEPGSWLGWIDEHETAGQLSPGVFGLLMPGVGPRMAEDRLARLRHAAATSAAGLALSSDAATPSEWIGRSVARLP
jgi:hypothetical protein